MKDSNSIELFENDLESMLSQVIAKACSRDKKLNKAKEKAEKLKCQMINSMLSWIWKYPLLLLKKNANF